MKKISKMYAGFKVMNLTTKQTEMFIYTFGCDNVYAENCAIQQLMQETGLGRGQFVVCELIKR